MLINTNDLKDVLKKATLNYSIDSVQLNFTKESVTSKMITSSSDGITILNVPNTILPDMKKTDNIVMNFSEPSTNLLPYLNLIDDSEETVVNIHDEKITLIQNKQKSNMFFCSPTVVSIFTGDSLRSDIKYFKEYQIDSDFIDSFGKIKKIGSKFNKIYFGVSDNVLYIETSDKQNRFSNGLRVDICDVKKDDMSMCFDFKNVVNLMTVLNGSSDDFTIHFAYVDEQELGMMFFSKEDDSELYYIMSRRDQ
jgi:hypothetical protein